MVHDTDFLWYWLYLTSGTSYTSPYRRSKMDVFHTLKMAIEEDCSIEKVYGDGRRILFWENPWV